MAQEDFEDHLRKKGLDQKRIVSAIQNANAIEKHLKAAGRHLRDITIEDLDRYLGELIENNGNSPDRLIDLARYFSFNSRPDLFIHMAALLNSYDILTLMERRTAQLLGEEKKEAVFHGFNMPPLGTRVEELPPLTSRIIKRMEGELTPEQCREVLIWNYHEIPKEAFADKKKRFDAADSIDDFLKEEHQSLLQELSECLRTGKVWYEQEVTKEFIDHVAKDQRVQVGVREGDRIIHEKVPFDTKRYYKESSPAMKAYYYCHCPLVRSSIKTGYPKVSPTFCNCSAGFLKAAWDAIFDEPVEVELLESILAGDSRCLFSVKIPPHRMK